MLAWLAGRRAPDWVSAAHREVRQLLQPYDCGVRRPRRRGDRWVTPLHWFGLRVDVDLANPDQYIAELMRYRECVERSFDNIEQLFGYASEEEIEDLRTQRRRQRAEHVLRELGEP